MRKNQKILLLIISFTFLVRFFYILTLGETLAFPDSARYDRIAIGIKSGEGYQTTCTAPLYPLFLAGVYSLLGRSFFAVRTVQALFECISAYVVFLLAKSVFKEKTGLLAAAIFALYPFFIFFSGLILTETLFILLLLIFIYLLKKLIESFSCKYAALCGLAGGACVLIKPTMFYFVPLALIYYIIVLTGKRAELTKNFALVIAFLVLTMAPWGIINYRKYGQTAFLTTRGGYTLRDSLNPRTIGGTDGSLIERTEEMEFMDAFELDKHFKRQAIEFVLKNPGRFAQLMVMKQIRFWSPVPNFSEYRNIKYGLIGLLSFTPVLFFALWALFPVRAGGKKWMDISFICLPIIFFTLLHTVILGSIRYRIPIDPFIIILASGKIADLTGKNKTHFN